MKRKIESDEDEDVPLSARKKSKKATSQKTKKKKRKHADDDDSDTEPEETSVGFFPSFFSQINLYHKMVCFISCFFFRNQRRKIQK